MRPITEIAANLGLDPQTIVPYGTYKAKIPLDAIRETDQRGKLVVVTGMTPTRAGEGKTTTSVGLAQGLGMRGKSVVATLREPSLGPIFGIKGGGTGGDKARVVPEDEINVHFTGDAHAVGSAHNLLAALTDNAVQRGQIPGLEPAGISWRRVTDVEDRALRTIVTGIGGAANAPVQETGFDIVTASEIMAILALSSDLEDLRARLNKIVVGFTAEGAPVSAGDVGAVGSMMSLLRYAILPNLVQTTEGQPVLVHTGPFGNIAHGCSSVVADRLALSYAEYVITEAGFGADLGFEKFMHIKARSNGLEPSAAVLVASVRALRSHGGARVRELDTPNLEAVEKGIANLEHLVGVVRSFGLPVVVAINRFPVGHNRGDRGSKGVRRGCGRLCRRREQCICRGRSGRSRSGRRRDRSHVGSTSGSVLPLPSRRLHRRQGPEPRNSSLWCRRRAVECCGQKALEGIQGTWLGRPPNMYGQDPPFFVPQSKATCPPHWLHFRDIGSPCIRGRWIHLPYRGRYRDHARATGRTASPGRGQ